MDCADVKQQLEVDALACVYPYPEDQIAYRVQKWVTNRRTTIHCDFFERELGWKFYIYKTRFYVVKGNEILFKNFDGCGMTEYNLTKMLYNENKEIFMMFLYSLYSKMCISIRIAAAYDTAYAATEAAYTAAYDAANAAYDAAEAVYNAAYAAANAAYAASAAAYDAAYTAYTAYNAKKHSRKAFRKLILLRKQLLKEAE